MEYSPMSGLNPISVPQWHGSLGTEPELTMYIGHLVAIYREVWRVLRDDGVAWVVMGDSYAANRSYQVPQTKWCDVGNEKPSQVPTGLKQGDLMLVPHRLALALQADGWVVRNDLVYSKKSPMPESLRGWSWQKHRIKVRSGRYDSDEKQGVNPTGAGFNQRCRGEEGWAAQWTDCPGIFG